MFDVGKWIDDKIAAGLAEYMASRAKQKAERRAAYKEAQRVKLEEDKAITELPEAAATQLETARENVPDHLGDSRATAQVGSMPLKENVPDRHGDSRHPYAAPKFALASASKRKPAPNQLEQNDTFKRQRKVFNASGVAQLVDREAVEENNNANAVERTQNGISNNVSTKVILSATFDTTSPFTDLMDLCRMARRCIDVSDSLMVDQDDENLVSRFRELVQRASIAEFSRQDVRNASTGTDRDFRLLRTFARNETFPLHLRSDIMVLWKRLQDGIYDGTLLRGIRIQRSTFEDGRQQKWKVLDKDEQKRPSDVVGKNGLENGQWWGWRVCAMRDGAHGSFEAGIYGRDKIGAYR